MEKEKAVWVRFSLFPSVKKERNAFFASFFFSIYFATERFSKEYTERAINPSERK